MVRPSPTSDPEIQARRLFFRTAANWISKTRLRNSLRKTDFVWVFPSPLALLHRRGGGLLLHVFEPVQHDIEMRHGRQLLFDGFEHEKPLAIRSHIIGLAANQGVGAFK